MPPDPTPTSPSGVVVAPSVRVVGPGRAGGSLCAALAAAGWRIADPVRRGDDPAGAAVGVDLVVVSTPDAAVADVAAIIAPVDGAVVAHLAGSLGLAALAPHVDRLAIHPVASLPDPAVGAERLRGAWYALTASTERAAAMATSVVEALDGRGVWIVDADRVAHHAAATIAANHLVALLAQVEAVAPTGVPLGTYLDMARDTLDNVSRLGPARALTGPASRGDVATLARHLAVLPPDERDAYEALAARATRLAAERDAATESGGSRCRS